MQLLTGGFTPLELFFVLFFSHYNHKLQNVVDQHSTEDNSKTFSRII